MSRIVNNKALERQLQYQVIELAWGGNLKPTSTISPRNWSR